MALRKRAVYYTRRRRRFKSPTAIFSFFLWPPYGIGPPYGMGMPLYFHPVVSIFYLLVFPRLISAVGEWMSTILPHMLWL